MIVSRSTTKWTTPLLSTSTWISSATELISGNSLGPSSIVFADLTFSAFFNDQSYTSPKVPTLYTALSSGSFVNNADIYGSATNSFVLQKGEVVEIIVNSGDPGKHPFHLHGHDFQTVVRSAGNAGAYVGNESFPTIPMRRDVFLVEPKGNIVLRFKANNPDESPCHLFLPPVIQSDPS